MLLLGVRGAGPARRFLVQNWWRRHQFVELSLAYLEALRDSDRGPDLAAHAVRTPQLAVPAGFARAAAPYAESAHLDAREPELRIGGGAFWL